MASVDHAIECVVSNSDADELKVLKQVDQLASKTLNLYHTL